MIDKDSTKIREAAEALMGAFVFSNSEQGREYWWGVIHNLENMVDKLEEVEK